MMILVISLPISMGGFDPILQQIKGQLVVQSITCMNTTPEREEKARRVSSHKINITWPTVEAMM
jgi:hypothetical protein